MSLPEQERREHAAAGIHDDGAHSGHRPSHVEIAADENHHRIPALVERRCLIGHQLDFREDPAGTCKCDRDGLLSSDQDQRAAAVAKPRTPFGKAA